MSNTIVLIHDAPKATPSKAPPVAATVGRGLLASDHGSEPLGKIAALHSIKRTVIGTIRANAITKKAISINEIND
ncbi:MAG: hypothetical protein F6K26_31920 [Moorea sp. SIO2I5]|nr:hypothetical protein [Moorena sp. SIO2I5]